MHSLSGQGSSHRFMAALFLSILFLVPVIAAQEMVVGVNVVNPLRANLADQNSLLDELKAAQVHVIRCGISNDDKGIDFAKRAAAAGIRIQLIANPEYAPGALAALRSRQVPFHVGLASAFVCRP